MKNIFLLLCILFSLKSMAQPIKSSRITQTESVRLLESIQSMEVFKGEQLHVSIFKSSNGSGSAKVDSENSVVLFIEHGVGKGRKTNKVVVSQRDLKIQ